jgi:hypothetical protein
MKYALTKISDNTIIRIQEFEPSEVPQLNPIKDLVWVEYVEPEPVLPSIQSLKIQKIEDLKSHRDYLVLNGGHKIGNNWFHSNEISLIQQLVLDGMAKQMANQGAPDSMPLPNIPSWKTMQGTFVQLTVGIAKNFVLSAMQQQGALFAKGEQKIAEINALTTREEIESYDISSDFPEVYE